MANKNKTFAERAKKIKKKYGSRIEDGDRRAIRSMENELKALFEEQEKYKAENSIESNKTQYANGGKYTGPGDPDYVNYHDDPDYLQSQANESGMRTVHKVTTTGKDGINRTSYKGTYNPKPGNTAGNAAENTTGNPTQDPNALTNLDALNYGAAMATPVAQMLNTSKPEMGDVYLQDYVNDLPNYYNQEGRNMVDRNQAATTDALIESGNYNPYTAAATLSQTDKATSRLAQDETDRNFSTELKRKFANADIMGRNLSKMYRRDRDYDMDLAAYEDMINTYIGNIGSNLSGVTEDVQNRQTINRMFPNYGTGARSKNNSNINSNNSNNS